LAQAGKNSGLIDARQYRAATSLPSVHHQLRCYRCDNVCRAAYRSSIFLFEPAQIKEGGIISDYFVAVGF
jgi:hypothetical protein